jgi:hypothetical protein
MSTRQCGGKGHGARRPPAPISAKPGPPLQYLSASVSPPRQRAYILVPHDQPRIPARSRRRPPVGYERGGVQITRFGATPGVHLGDQVAGHNEASFARLPPAPTTLCYLRLSATSAVGSSVSRLCGWRPMPGRAALNELSAPVLIVHNVPHRSIMPVIKDHSPFGLGIMPDHPGASRSQAYQPCAVVLAEARADHNAADGSVLARRLLDTPPLSATPNRGARPAYGNAA